MTIHKVTDIRGNVFYQGESYEQALDTLIEHPYTVLETREIKDGN